MVKQVQKANPTKQGLKQQIQRRLLFRDLSAVAQSFASKPKLAPFEVLASFFPKVDCLAVTGPSLTELFSLFY